MKENISFSRRNKTKPFIGVILFYPSSIKLLLHDFSPYFPNAITVVNKRDFHFRSLKLYGLMKSLLSLFQKLVFLNTTKNFVTSIA